MVIHLVTRLAMGGAQQLVYDITKRMYTSGQDVLILTGLSDKRKSASAWNNRILEAVYEAGIPVEVCPYLQSRISLINDLRSVVWLIVKLKAHQPTVVHIHSSKAGIIGRLACKLAGIDRVVFHVHGWSFSSSRGLARRIYLELEKAFVALTTDYIFVCRQDMKDFIHLGGDPRIETRSHIIYPGLNFSECEEDNTSRHEFREALGLKDHQRVVGSIGRLDYQKNPQLFVAIAAQYAEVDSDAHFIWVGEGVERDEIEHRVQELELEDRFTLTGFVQDVEPYYEMFDVFALTSRYEGLPITVIRAIAYAIPVVGFLSNGMIDLDERFPSVLGVPPGDIAEFVRQLEVGCAMSVAERALLEEEARWVRENLNDDRMYDAILEVYGKERTRKREPHTSLEADG